jgi:hypothetical protein
MAPAATLHFHGFPGLSPRPVLLPADGDPAGAARRLAELNLGSSVRSLPRGFLALDRCGGDPAATAASCLYRYEIRLHQRRGQSVWIACWRRYPAGIGWQRRCGPMPLRIFLERFLDRRCGGLNRSGGPAPV